MSFPAQRLASDVVCLYVYSTFSGFLGFFRRCSPYKCGVDLEDICNLKHLGKLQKIACIFRAGEVQDSAENLVLFK